jgi:carboxyl-terminal processing protease
LVAVASVAFTLSTARGQPPADTLATRQARIVKLVREHFFDAKSGAAWAEAHHDFARAAKSDADFRFAAQTALAKLRASHTGYFDRDAPEFYALRSIFAPALKLPSVECASVGMDVTADHVVRVVFAQGPAEKAGLRRGDKILSANGQPFHRITSFRGLAGKQVELQVQRTAEGKPGTVRLKPEMVDAKKEWLRAQIAGTRVVEVAGKRVGYVPMVCGAGEEFEAALREAVMGPLQNTVALVLDFRDGWGGCNPSLVNLFNRQPPVLSFTDRDKQTTLLDSQWRKPCVLLINEGTRSGKEVVAASLKKHGLAKLVGTTTAGAVLAGRCFPLGDEAVLYLPVADVRVDGKRLEGVGVTPDVEVTDSLLYANGQDAQLAAALKEAVR